MPALKVTKVSKMATYKRMKPSDLIFIQLELKRSDYENENRLVWSKPEKRSGGQVLVRHPNLDANAIIRLKMMAESRLYPILDRYKGLEWLQTGII